MKTSSDFTYEIHGNIIAIEDLDLGNKSVTNDIENVLCAIRFHEENKHQGFKANFDFDNKRIIYKDSEGIWDEVIVSQIEEFFRGNRLGKTLTVKFSSLGGCKTKEEAIEVIQSRKILNS